ncbi:MAG: carboxymuconolactone decarboxylase family protein [Lautropia sp.]
MAFIETISPEAADGAVAEMYLRQQRAWGFVPNYAKVFCHRPEVLARWGQLLAEIKRPMDKRRFELVTFVAAYELGNSACALAHARALTEFFSDEQIRAIAAGDCDGILADAEQAMLAFARQIAVDAPRTTQAQAAALRAHGYDDAEIFDIAATAAGRAFWTKLLDALGVLADSPMLALDESLRRALTVGRPIDVAECVTMREPSVS